jgi:hypothetical protein
MLPVVVMDSGLALRTPRNDDFTVYLFNPSIGATLFITYTDPSPVRCA